MGKGIGGIESHRVTKEEWLTPPELVAAIGPFDLDPCSPIDRPWPTAANHFTIRDDGLSQAWEGFVYCNPPYGYKAAAWLAKLSHHPGGGIALLFARTETKMFRTHVWGAADGLLFLHGRLTFHHASGEAAQRQCCAPSVLVAYGGEALLRLARSGIAGSLIENWS